MNSKQNGQTNEPTNCPAGNVLKHGPNKPGQTKHRGNETQGKQTQTNKTGGETERHRKTGRRGGCKDFGGKTSGFPRSSLIKMSAC